MKNGIIEGRWGKFFDDVFEGRQRGDYRPLVVFEPDQVAEFLEQADIFLKELEKLIKL